MKMKGNKICSVPRAIFSDIISLFWGLGRMHCMQVDFHPLKVISDKLRHSRVYISLLRMRWHCMSKSILRFRLKVAPGSFQPQVRNSTAKSWWEKVPGSHPQDEERGIGSKIPQLWPRWSVEKLKRRTFSVTTKNWTPQESKEHNGCSPVGLPNLKTNKQTNKNA